LTIIQLNPAQIDFYFCANRDFGKRVDFWVDANWPIKFTQIDIYKYAKLFEIPQIGTVSTVYALIQFSMTKSCRYTEHALPNLMKNAMAHRII
jgi:hypothetical protein